MFQEDAYDFDEKIDGRGPFNWFLSKSYALEATTALFIILVFRMLRVFESK